MLHSPAEHRDRPSRQRACRGHRAAVYLSSTKRSRIAARCPVAVTSAQRVRRFSCSHRTTPRSNRPLRHQLEHDVSRLSSIHGNKARCARHARVPRGLQERRCVRVLVAPDIARAAASHPDQLRPSVVNYDCRKCLNTTCTARSATGAPERTVSQFRLVGERRAAVFLKADRAASLAIICAQRAARTAITETSPHPGTATWNNRNDPSIPVRVGRKNGGRKARGDPPARRRNALAATKSRRWCPAHRNNSSRSRDSGPAGNPRGRCLDIA